MEVALRLSAQLPFVAHRQWTLSLPRGLRLAVVKQPRVLKLVERALVRAVWRWQRAVAKRLGVTQRLQGGAVAFTQWFSSALALTPHLHVLLPEVHQAAAKDEGVLHQLFGLCVVAKNAARDPEGTAGEALIEPPGRARSCGFAGEEEDNRRTPLQIASASAAQVSRQSCLSQRSRVPALEFGQTATG